ncbi:hypothetical protein QTO34_013469 [Cnephaeus nilssonii]|uniref:Uncharacterized protein n=1 Tax=Cnephaeus nilssonii TaxID=3371016 RepID=A0AA40I7X9_CNENI|nr:hypothetical protein QTO34_013469 [Eptesicus nilssonii]
MGRDPPLCLLQPRGPQFLSSPSLAGWELLAGEESSQVLLDAVEMACQRLWKQEVASGAMVIVSLVDRVLAVGILVRWMFENWEEGDPQERPPMEQENWYMVGVRIPTPGFLWPPTSQPLGPQEDRKGLKLSSLSVGDPCLRPLANSRPMEPYKSQIFVSESPSKLARLVSKSAMPGIQHPVWWPDVK